MNKRLVRTPFLIPKISTILQEMEGFTYASVLYLTMDFYTIRLDPDAQKICTIILPWGTNGCRWIVWYLSRKDVGPNGDIGICKHVSRWSPYHNTRSSCDDHLTNMSKVLCQLQKAGLRINAAKSFYAEAEMKYLGYVLMREGIKLQPEKNWLF